ncbi:MAG: murein biosynthesis integral membrane protein MurJ [Bdellovibrionales bacterium]
MKLVKAMVTVAGLTGVSRVAGFVRDVMTAAILGAGPVADAFFVALKLPNFFRRVTAEGAFSVAFVPVYSEKLETEDRQSADAFASNVFMVMLLLLSAFVCLAMVAMPYILHVIAPGFVDDPVRFDLAVELTRITFPYLLFMSLTAMLGGVLNALDRFAPFAFAPVLFNLCLIGALLSSDFFDSAGHAVSYGVLFAGVLQLAWLVICASRLGFKIKFKMPAFNIDIKRIFKLMGPGVIGAGVMHINLFADMILASFLATGSIAYLYYADRLNQLPLGVVGIAVGTALLPMLSKALTNNNLKEGRDLFNRALEMCLLLALPAAAALFVIPELLISVLFERGAFTAADTEITALVLRCYAIGLPAYIAIKVFSTAHWARQDTVTPVKISVVATVLNIALSIVLIQYMGVVGIALATGLTGWLQFGAHIWFLRDHEAARLDDRFKVAGLKIIGASVVMALIVYFGSMFAMSGDAFMQVFKLGALVAVGMAVYAVLIFSTGVVNTRSIQLYLKKKSS